MIIARHKGRGEVYGREGRVPVHSGPTILLLHSVYTLITQSLQPNRLPCNPSEELSASVVIRQADMGWRCSEESMICEWYGINVSNYE